MSQELEFRDLPELHLGITISRDNGQACLVLRKKITSPEKVRLLIEIIQNNQFIPAKIVIKDRLKFFSRLKQEKLI